MLLLATFRADITPPVGHPLCAGWYPSAIGVADPISANGVILFPDHQAPIVLCALDWAELSNGEYALWKDRLASAAGTSPERVAVHCIHAHDTPWPDRDAQHILDADGFPEIIMQTAWCDSALDNVASAVFQALSHKSPATEIREGAAEVSQIASNRRILDGKGKVRCSRWTKCRDESIRAEPEGLIDPFLKTLGFWNGETKLAALHYYAVHPTSYDGTGMVTPDFVGIARDRLAQSEGVPHIYFTECAGNITCGKYNDGRTDNREIFARRIMDAMTASEKSARPLNSMRVRWETQPVILPPREEAAHLLELIRNPETVGAVKSRAAIALAYRRRCESGIPIMLSALHLGDNFISVHLPGEAFVEYQLHAQSLRPEARVVVPSYGDCGPGYIPLEKSYAEGGYEPKDAFCSPASEAILRKGIETLVKKQGTAPPDTAS